MGHSFKEPTLRQLSTNSCNAMESKRPLCLNMVINSELQYSKGDTASSWVDRESCIARPGEFVPDPVAELVRRVCRETVLMDGKQEPGQGLSPVWWNILLHKWERWQIELVFAGQHQKT